MHTIHEGSFPPLSILFITFSLGVVPRAPTPTQLIELWIQRTVLSNSTWISGWQIVQPKINEWNYVHTEGGGGLERESNASDSWVLRSLMHSLSHANTMLTNSLSQQILYLIMCSLREDDPNNITMQSNPDVHYWWTVYIITQLHILHLTVAEMTQIEGCN